MGDAFWARCRRATQSPWLLWGSAAGLVIAVVVLVALAPRWSAPWVRGVLVDKVERRLGVGVIIDDVDLTWDRMELRGVRIGIADDEPHLSFDTIEVDLAGNVAWLRRVAVQTVRVTHGTVAGTRAQLEGLARQLRSAPKGAESPGPGGRLDITPETISVAGIQVSVSDLRSSEDGSTVDGVVAGEVRLREGDVDLEIRDARFDLGVGPVATVGRLATTHQIRRGTGGLTQAIAFPWTVAVERLSAQVNATIAVAGVDGTIEIFDPRLAEFGLDLSGTFSRQDGGEHDARGPKLWSASGRLRRDLSEGALSVDMEEFALGRLPDVLASLPLVDSEAATVGGHVEMVFGGGLARIEGDVEVAGLNVDHPTLARAVVRDVGFDLEFALEVDPHARWVRIAHARVARRGVAFGIRGELEHAKARQDRRYRLHASLKPVSCQDALNAIPKELVPGLLDFELTGELTSDLHLDVDFSDLENLVLEGDVGIRRCRAARAPARAAAERLAGAFVHRVVMRDGQERSIEMAPGAYGFTPLDEISPYVVSGVLTTEDGGFWNHRGFLPSQIRVALKRNLEADKIELGASTITMQMVKNVLLSHERTLSRKLQELFLTSYVESVLPKYRIMEIYLNAVEFGPGIYGVTHGAAHYFGKHPADLSPVEAVYLTLMLPSPVRRHSYYCNNALTPGFRTKVRRILGMMYERERLTDFEYFVWSETELEFDDRDRADENSCTREIEALLAATHTQRARSGLLEVSETSGVERRVDARTFLPRAARGELPRPHSERRFRVRPEPAEADAPGRPAMDALLDPR